LPWMKAWLDWNTEMPVRLFVIVLGATRPGTAPMRAALEPETRALVVPRDD